MQDVGPNSQYNIQTSADGSKSWTWTSADGATTYALHQTLVSIASSDRTTLQVISKWSFEAQSQIGSAEVQGSINQITDAADKSQAQQAFDGAVANEQVAFIKTVSGADTTYQWNDAMDVSVLQTLSLASTPAGIQVSFSTEMPLAPQGLASLGQNLTDPARLAQFNAAIQDVIPLGSVPPMQWTQLTRTKDSNGRVTSWSWTSADGLTTYKLMNDKVWLLQPDQSYEVNDFWKSSRNISRAGAAASKFAARSASSNTRAARNKLSSRKFLTTSIVQRSSSVSPNW